MKTITKLMGAFIFGLTGMCNASIIYWQAPQNAGMADPDLHILNSQGNFLDASYFFELGTFVSGFTPDSTNLDQWAANWLTFDLASASNGGWDPSNQGISRDPEHTITGGSNSSNATPGAVFAQGAPAYLWVYNSKNLSLTPEWALLEDVDNGSNLYGAWEFPDPSLAAPASIDWAISDIDTPIYGGVNGVRGAGDFAVQPASFAIQTAAVPEPSSALLMGLGGIWVLRRGRRSSQSKA